MVVIVRSITTRILNPRARKCAFTAGQGVPVFMLQEIVNCQKTHSNRKDRGSEKAKTLKTELEGVKAEFDKYKESVHEHVKSAVAVEVDRIEKGFQEG